MKEKKRRSRAGFTLVELMVVVVIIGILAGVVVVNYAGRAGKARAARIKHDFKMIESAIDFFHMDTHSYPNTIEELLSSDAAGWDGPYLKKPPLDPWDEYYIYEYSGEEGMPYELKSLGADRAEGGTGDNKDYSTLDFLEETGLGR